MKDYNKPEINDELIEIEDICALSNGGVYDNNSKDTEEFLQG